jgi:hypothetical protein
MRTWLAVAFGLLLPVGVAAAPLDEFARCLADTGVTYYWTTSCPHCQRQQALFGRSMRLLNAVECSSGCPGITAYPTWRFADGSRVTGFTQPAVLASRTRCALDRPASPLDDGPTDDASGDGTRTRYLGGAKLIEVPRR